ncbi:hypothetical protein GWI33_005086 [Rhynchophorus ferrugineus]|uniref:Uncharacterized protein n=1 Tax=Rhynchophorus ferrugineus TaxID=354439 RepID=A0A834IJT0_RHYFE|nr:hypothetical protein GWI33_005086 [Rhynchophorus ferrugineus]
MGLLDEETDRGVPGDDPVLVRSQIEIDPRLLWSVSRRPFVVLARTDIPPPVSFNPVRRLSIVWFSLGSYWTEQ